MKTLFPIMISLFFPFFSLFAQPAALNLQQITGSSKPLSCSAETETYIWAGADDMLYRVKKSNHKVKKYCLRNNALQRLHITCMAARKNGELFIGTDAGLFRYDNYAFIQINRENSRLESDSIVALVCDANEDIWVATNSRTSIARIQSGMKMYATPECKPENCPSPSFELNEKGEVILIYARKRLVFQDGRFEQLLSENQSSHTQNGNQ